MNSLFFLIYSVIGLCTYLFFLRYIRNDIASMMEIMASLSCKTIEDMLARLRKFENYLYFDSEIIEQTDPKENLKAMATKIHFESVQSVQGNSDGNP